MSDICVQMLPYCPDTRCIQELQQIWAGKCSRDQEQSTDILRDTDASGGREVVSYEPDSGVWALLDELASNV